LSFFIFLLPGKLFFVIINAIYSAKLVNFATRSKNNFPARGISMENKPPLQREP